MASVPHRLRSLAAVDLPIQITIANILALGFSFLSVPVIARSIGVEGRGLTAAVVSAFILVPVVVGLGLPLEVRRRSARAIDEASVRGARDIAVMMTAPAALVAVLLDQLVFKELGEDIRTVAFVGIAGSAVSVLWAIDVGALVGAGRYRAVFVLRVVQPAIILVSLTPLWIARELTASVVLVVYVLSNLIAALVGSMFVRVSWRGERRRRIELARVGLTFAGSAVAESAAARFDQILVLPLIGAVQAGYYTLATSIAILPIALSHALAAKHFRDVATAAPGNIGELVARGIQECLALAVPVCLFLGLAGIWFVPMLVGEEFRPSVTVLFVLLPGAAAMSTAYLASALLAAQGRGIIMTATQLAGLAVNLILLVPLGSRFGAHGAAWASTAGYMLLVVLQLQVLKQSPTVLVPSIRAMRSGIRSLTR